MEAEGIHWTSLLQSIFRTSPSPRDGRKQRVHRAAVRASTVRKNTVDTHGGSGSFHTVFTECPVGWALCQAGARVRPVGKVHWAPGLLTLAVAEGRRHTGRH